MSKLYVAKMVIIKPIFFSSDGGAKIKTEDILVKKTMFGYREVLTGHHFIKGTYLASNADSCDPINRPYKVCNPNIIKRLEDGKTQFLIDDYFNLKAPIREAEETDIQTIVDNFENSTLNKYPQEQQAKRERKKQEHRRTNEYLKGRRQLIKTRQKQQKNG